MLEKIRGLTVTLLLVHSGAQAATVSVANAASTVGEECYRCADWEYEARAEALGISVLPTGKVFLLDRYHNQLKKYLITSEPTTANGNTGTTDTNQQKPVDSALFFSLGADEKDIIDHITIPRRSFLIDIWELAPTADEQHSFTTFDTLAEDILHIHQPSARGAGTNTLSFNLPSGAVAGVSSAHDVIGNRSRGLQVGLWVTNTQIDALFWHQVLEEVTQRFALRFALSYDFNVKINFPDGSYGFWDVNNTTKSFEALFATFADSDGNTIPLTSNDVVGRGYYFSEGPGSDNYKNMVHRVIFLGGSVGDTPSGGGSCDFFCNAALACTLSCSVK